MTPSSSATLYVKVSLKHIFENDFECFHKPVILIVKPKVNFMSQILKKIKNSINDKKTPPIKAGLIFLSKINNY